MKVNNGGMNFDNSYLTLDNRMYTKLNLKNTFNPNIEVLNEKLAKSLGFDIEYLKSDLGLKILSGSVNNVVQSGYAQAYSGHQFGHLNILGDGRTLMLGEHVTDSGNRFDIQLKGSGRTPYSRGGDGKATLYSMLREYIISEAMYSLNIPTARTLAVLKTNEAVQRTQPSNGSILTRVASSHIRVGTFVYALTQGGYKALQKLADYTINRHYKHLNNDPDKYQKFLTEVIDKQASLIAKWQSVGFIHGVLNTDNVLISGETIDYGPCAFMNEFDPNTVFSSIDKDGRYAFGNQPYIGSWNLARFTETILHLFSEDKEKAVEIANNELSKYEIAYNKHYLTIMASKLGISNPVKSDMILINELLELMKLHKEDYTNTFKYLTINQLSNISMSNSLEFKNWFVKWRKRLENNNINTDVSIALMKIHNPVIIPRNNMIENALVKASTFGDYTLFNEMLKLLEHPFNYELEIRDEFLSSPIDTNKYVTYCGT